MDAKTIIAIVLAIFIGGAAIWLNILLFSTLNDAPFFTLNGADIA